MKFSAAFILPCSCLLLMAAPRRAHAEQFVLLDLTYEATSANTMNSHFNAKPAAGIPANWRTPINYANGSAHVRFEVLSAPSATKTLYNICFENTAMSCLGYPPAYSGPGVTNFSNQFSMFWNYNVIDWSKPITNVALVLKNERELKVHGDPAHYPYKMHVTITVVAPGSTYVPPDVTGMNGNAGTGAAMAGTGAAGSRAGTGGSGGAGGMRSGGAGQASGGTSGSAGTGGAPSETPTPDAGAPSDPEPTADAATTPDPSDEPTPPRNGPRQLDPQPNTINKRAPPPGDLEAGCSIGRSQSNGALALVSLAAISFSLRRRKRRRS